ncbi:MAG: M13 family metallopeptidase [Blastomonas sp.]
MTIKSILFASAASLALSSLPARAETAPQDSDAVRIAEDDAAAEGISTLARDYWGSWGIDTSVMNRAVKPGDDFNAYVNGAWIDSFELPDDRVRYGSFNLLREKSEQRVRLIIEGLASEQPALDTAPGKVAAFYNAYLDTDAINAAGMAPAQPYLDRIMAMESKEDLARLFGTPGFSSPIGGFVSVDSKNTEQYTFYVVQAGLGMPDRDYYLNDSEANLKVQAAYKQYLAFLLGKVGYADPQATAESVYALEKAIASEHWDRALGRNRNLTYNKVSRDELLALGGDFPVATILDTLGIGSQPEFVISQMPPTAEEIASEKLTEEQLAKLGGGVPALLKLVNDTPIDTWKAYLAAQFLANFSAVLPSDIDEATFAFYGTTLNGQKAQRDRWKRGVEATENALGEVVGQVYADKYFPAENKAAMEELVANLRKAMAANIKDLSWMGDATKVAAQEKLDKFTPKIGYPVKFEAYDGMKIVNGNALANAMAANEWAQADNISDLGKPIDKTEWGMFPQTVNAYYSPPRNEIVFPAAILQPPFFNLSADPAVNYGAIGGVIGHEMGHGFDDQGSKSDGDGILRNWWTEEDLANFKKLTSALASQYDAMCPLDEGKTCVNGTLTLGENIGDVGGLSMAYRAYKMSLNGEEAPVIDGLTGDQRFFMAWAQVWRAKAREEFLRNQLQTDPHSPPDFRVNGVVRNFDEWYKAFDVKPGDALYLAPEDRVRIW